MRRRTLVTFVLAAGLATAPWVSTPAFALGPSNWAVSLVALSHGEAASMALPAAPTASALCTSSTAKKVDVTFSTVALATAYDIYESVSTTSTPGAYTLLTPAATSSPWASPTLTAGDNYWFKVAAVVGTMWVGTQSAATQESTIAATNPKCVNP